MNCPKKTPSEDGKLVTVFGSDRFGEWCLIAVRKNYKQKPNVFAFRDGKTYWRFVNPETQQTIKFVEGWK